MIINENLKYNTVSFNGKYSRPVKSLIKQINKDTKYIVSNPSFHQFETIQNSLVQILSKDRFKHSVSAEITGGAICDILNLGQEKVKVMKALLLHDNAKVFKRDEFKMFADKYKLELLPKEKKMPGLIHGPLGSHFAKIIYKVKDIEILNAITRHCSSGRILETYIDKITKIADKIEPFLRDNQLTKDVFKILLKNEKNPNKALNKAIRYIELNK